MTWGLRGAGVAPAVHNVDSLRSWRLSVFPEPEMLANVTAPPVQGVPEVGIVVVVVDVVVEVVVVVGTAVVDVVVVGTTVVVVVVVVTGAIVVVVVDVVVVDVVVVPGTTVVVVVVVGAGLAWKATSTP